MVTATSTYNQTYNKKTKNMKTTRVHQGKHVYNNKKFMLGVCAFLLCFAVVMMSASAANLRMKNDKLQKENEYMQAEIDSLNKEIRSTTSIDKIEELAVGKLGMVHPDSENCITIEGNAGNTSNLAATIKDEAYN